MIAFHNGRRARADGQARTANPHPPGLERAQWNDGWDTADRILRDLAGCT